MDDVFEKLAELQRTHPEAVVKIVKQPTATAAAPSFDTGPLETARRVQNNYLYLRLDGAAKVRVEGGARSVMVDELVHSAITEPAERDNYVRGARVTVVPFGVAQADLPRFESVSEAKAKVPLLADAMLQLLSYEANDAPLSIVRSRLRVGTTQFTAPDSHGSLEMAVPVGLVDALAYDWRARGYVLVDINASDRLAGEPEELLLRRSSVQRLHYCAYLLQRMFVEQGYQRPPIAYLLFVGYLTSQQRTGMWRIAYEPERWLVTPPAGRAPLLYPEDLNF